MLAVAGQGQERHDPVVQCLRDKFPYFQGVIYTNADSDSSTPWSQESAFDAARSSIPTWIVTDFDAPRTSRQRVRRILLVVADADQPLKATCPCRINLTFADSACYGVAFVPALDIDARSITRFRGRQRW